MSVCGVYLSSVLVKELLRWFYAVGKKKKLFSLNAVNPTQIF